MIKKFKELFAQENKYKFVGFNDKEVCIYSIEKSNFEVLPYSVDSEDHIVMDIEKSKEISMSYHYTDNEDGDMDFEGTMMMPEMMSEVCGDLAKMTEEKDAMMTEKDILMAEKIAIITEFEEFKAFSLTANQKDEKLRSALYKFKYTQGDDTWSKYWLRDYDDTYVYVQDNEDEKTYRIKYSLDSNDLSTEAAIDIESKEEVLSAYETIEQNASKQVDMQKAETEKEKMMSEKAEFEAKLAELKVENEKIMSEVNEFKEQKFAEIIAQCSFEYKMSDEDIQIWTEKSKSFTEIDAFEKELVFAFHKVNKTKNNDAHFKMGNLNNKNNKTQSKSAIERLKAKSN